MDSKCRAGEERYYFDFSVIELAYITLQDRCAEYDNDRCRKGMKHVRYGQDSGVGMNNMGEGLSEGDMRDMRDMRYMWGGGDRYRDGLV